MRKTIVILVCLLLIAASAPLFAHGHRDRHGHSWKSNPHRWHGSFTHPAFHGWKGWGRALSGGPEGTPAEESPNPPDKPTDVPEVKPADKFPTGDDPLLDLMLDPFDGSFPG